MRIRFLNNINAVYTPHFLIETRHKKILIDCGLCEHFRILLYKDSNYIFPIDPCLIDAIILTGAHIKYSGYIPALVKSGFRGKIYCTPSTYDLNRILLLDQSILQEEECFFLNNISDEIMIPLYTAEETKTSFDYFAIIDFYQKFKIDNNITIQFFRSSCIIGSIILSIQTNDKKIVFTSCLQNLDKYTIASPEKIKKADYILIDPYHPLLNYDENILKSVIYKTIKNKGTILIQLSVSDIHFILHYIASHLFSKDIQLPIYIDSPMAINIGSTLKRYHLEHYMHKKECQYIFEQITYVGSIEESENLDHNDFPKIIITSSNTLKSGRILNHLKFFIGNANNTIILSDNNFENAYLIEKKIFIHNKAYERNAEIIKLSKIFDFSLILNWLDGFEEKPKKVFLTSNSQNAAFILQDMILKKSDWNIIIPNYNEIFDL